MTQQDCDCLKMIVLVVVLCGILDSVSEPLAEHARQVAAKHGCHSPRCFRPAWIFERL